MSATIKFVNDSGKDDSSVFVVFWADSDSDLSSPDVTNKTVYALSDLPGSAGERSITLNSFSSGRLYFSYDKKLDTSGLRPDGSNTGDDAYHKRYDKVEMTYPGTVNLTMVDFFAIPISLRTMDSSGGTLHLCTVYANTDDLKNTLSESSSAPATVIINDDTGNFMRVESPLKMPNDYASMQDYIDAVKGATLNIKGTYLSTGGNQDYDYTGTIGTDGTITLTMSGEETMIIPGATLADTIYTNMDPYTVGSNTNKHAGDNDMYSAVYRDIMAGFAAGFITTGENDSSTWWTKEPYTGQYYNKYAKGVWDEADAYGFPFNERLKAKTILLPMDDNNGVATVELTFLNDARLSAPNITSTSSTDNSITLEWDAVSGADGYYVRVGSGEKVSVSGTSYTASGLNTGTGYTLNLSAYAGTESSAERPVTVSTTGSVQPHTGSFAFNLTLFFTTAQFGDSYSINGTDYVVPTTTTGISGQLVQLTGDLNTMNDYPFTYGDTFKSTLHVNLDATGITSSPSDFVLDNNQAASVPTPPNQCALSIQPNG